MFGMRNFGVLDIWLGVLGLGFGVWSSCLKIMSFEFLVCSFGLRSGILSFKFGISSLSFWNWY